LLMGLGAGGVLLFVVVLPGHTILLRGGDWVGQCDVARLRE
jgi:hypothetical protein